MKEKTKAKSKEHRRRREFGSGKSNSNYLLFIFRLSFFCFLGSHLQGASLLQPASAAQNAESHTDSGHRQERTFKKALPGYKFRFPEDHYAHNEFKTEWWYYTGHLESKTGKSFGFELTFFRSGVPTLDRVQNSPWSIDNIYMTHFAISDVSGKKFFHDAKICRAGVKNAGAMGDKYKVWTENWSAALEDGKHKLRAKSGDYSIDLTLDEGKRPVIHGENGVSQKASCVGCASHYYSLTRMPARGSITVPGLKDEISGIAWMDHEFGSNQLTKEQVGWDWYSIQLSDGSELMLYAMRLKNGQLDQNSSGTFIRQDGSTEHLSLASYNIETLESWKSARTNANYPAKWRVKIPSKNLELTITPQIAEQELVNSGGGVSYWEGTCSVAGKKDGKNITGRAYVELTGYDKAFDRRI